VPGARSSVAVGALSAIPISVLLRHFDSLAGRVVAVWGPPEDGLLEGLGYFGAETRVHPSRETGAQIMLELSPHEIVRGADALILAEDYQEPDLGWLLRAMRTPVIYDGQGLWAGKELRRLGFTYFGR
jgi:hypothetical protein